MPVATPTEETTPDAAALAAYREPVTTFPVRIPLGKGRAVTIDFINVLTMGTVLIPTILVVLLAVRFWGLWAGPFEIGLFVVFTFATGLGITMGYHRFFTHGAFEAAGWVKRTLGVLGAFAAQGPLLFWCSCHRLHHQHSDHEGDPHSPHLSGGGWAGWAKGLFHAHMGWIVVAGRYRYKAKTVRDLYSDPDVRFVDHYYLYWLFLSVALPALLGGLWHRSWEGAAMGFVWGGVLRICFVHHFTWAVNSFGHVYGDKPFRSHDESRNNFFLAMMGLGDGWHNNHHAFPRSARHGFAWWELDFTYQVILALEKLGLVWRVRRIPQEQIEAKRARPGTKPEAAAEAATSR